MVTKYYDVKQRSDEWIKIRSSCDITASVAPALLGYDENCSTSEAINKIVYQINDDLSSNPFVINGINLESIARETLEIELDKKINECGIFVFNYWLGGSPDGLVEGESAIVEIKCPYKNFDIKEKYIVQCLINMMLADAEKCYLYIYDHTGVNSKLEPIVRDRDRESEILSSLYEIKCDMPEYKKQLDNLLNDILCYEDISEEIKRLETKKKELSAKIIDMTVNGQYCAKHKISHVVRDGAINHRKYCLDHGITVGEEYRGEPTKYLKIS